MKHLKKGAVNSELIVLQLVDRKVSEQLAINVLTDRELTKEEKLYSIMIEECDNDGVLLMNDLNKDILLKLVDIKLNTYVDCLYNWRKKGLITTSGKYVTFKIFVNRHTTKGIFISRHS